MVGSCRRCLELEKNISVEITGLGGSSGQEVVLVFSTMCLEFGNLRISLPRVMTRARCGTCRVPNLLRLYDPV